MWEEGGTAKRTSPPLMGTEVEHVSTRGAKAAQAAGVPGASERLRVPTKRALWEEGGTAKRTSPPLVGAEVEHVSTRGEEEQVSALYEWISSWRAEFPQKIENGKLIMIGLPQSQQALWERGGNARKAKLFPQSGKTSKKGEFRRGGEDGNENRYSQSNERIGAYCI